MDEKQKALSIALALCSTVIPLSAQAQHTYSVGPSTITSSVSVTNDITIMPITSGSHSLDLPSSTNNQTLSVTNNSGDAKFQLTGSLSLAVSGQNGASTTLVGTNTYTGTTTINNGGWLRIGNSGAYPATSPLTVNTGGTFDLNGFNTTVPSLAGSGSVALGSGALTAGDDNTSTVFSGVISGSGAVEKRGGGMLTLSGTNTYSGGTTVSGGALKVTGSVAGMLNVLNGGTLMGTGTVGSVDSSGIVAPGASIGTLRVSGNYTQRSNGTLQVEISPSQADRLIVGGTASLDGALSVLPQTGSYASGTKYPIINAQSVSGTFKTVSVSNSDRLGGLTVGVNYLGTEVNLELMTPLAASSRQQEEAVKVAAPEVARQATRLQTTIISNHIASILFPPDFARALVAPKIEIPGPDGGGGTGTGTGTGGTDKKKRDDGKSSSLGTSGLAAGDQPSGNSYDLKGFAAWGDASLAMLDNTDAASKYNGLHKAATIGADYRLNDQTLLGLAFTPDQADINLRSVDGNRTSTGLSGSVYAAYKFDDEYAISAIVGYGRVFNFTRQPIGGVEVKDNYGSNRYLAQVTASAGYLVQEDMRLTPSLSYTHSLEIANTHHSSDGADVNVPTIRLGTVKVATQLDYAVTEQIVPFVIGGVERDIVNSGGAGRRLGYSLGGGIQAPLDDNLTLGLAATTNFGRGAQSETQIAANIRYAW